MLNDQQINQALKDPAVQQALDALVKERIETLQTEGILKFLLFHGIKYEFKLKSCTPDQHRRIRQYVVSAFLASFSADFEYYLKQLLTTYFVFNATSGVQEQFSSIFLKGRTLGDLMRLVKDNKLTVFYGKSYLAKKEAFEALGRIAECRNDLLHNKIAGECKKQKIRKTNKYKPQRAAEMQKHSQEYMYPGRDVDIFSIDGVRVLLEDIILARSVFMETDSKKVDFVKSNNKK